MQLLQLFPEGLYPVLPVLIPVGSALLIAVLAVLSQTVRGRQARGVSDGIAVLAFAATLLYVYQLGVRVWAGGVQTFVWSSGGTTYPGPLGVVLAADAFSVFLMGLFTVMGLVVSIYSIGYMSHDTGLQQYYALLLIMVGAMNGVVVACDLFTLFMFYETMGLSSFVLVAFRRDWEGIEAAIKYLMMSAVGSTLVLFSASYLYGLTGTLNIGAMAQAVQSDPDNPLIGVLIALLTAGFGVKGAVVPFAAWLADAHPAAPSGISAMLSGVVIKVGIYGIVRVNVTLFSVSVPYFDWPLLLATFALVTMTAGNFWALTQTDLKRMLAYSSITQIGFILFAFGTFTEFGYQTGTFYILSHALTKGLLFLCAGAFLHSVGTRDLNELEGIGKRMPFTGAVFVLGVLSLMGMPPLAGFYAKVLILMAGVSAGITQTPLYVGFTLVAIFNALLALGYYLRMLQVVWLRPPSDRAQGAHPASRSMQLAMLLMAAALLLIGLYPAPVYSIASAAGSALYNAGSLVSAVLGAQSP